jgi:hypothetical protein
VWSFVSDAAFGDDMDIRNAECRESRVRSMSPSRSARDRSRVCRAPAILSRKCTLPPIRERPMCERPSPRARISPREQHTVRDKLCLSQRSSRAAQVAVRSRKRMLYEAPPRAFTGGRTGGKGGRDPLAAPLWHWCCLPSCSARTHALIC